jgi:non-homologous end joining protein Ku
MKKQSNAGQVKASLILLGFKPKDSVPLHYNVEQAFYLYPNEDKVKGSTAAFANLRASMMRRKGVVAIGELLTQVTATSRLVAIFPQDEKCLPEEAGGDLEVPQCMVAYSLSFEGDVRELDADSGTTTENTVQAAANLGHEVRG